MLGNRKEAYAALFRAAWDTLAAFAKRQGIQIGMTALLHTWGSALAFHPHLHCIVPAGGRDVKTGRWKNLPWVRDGKGTEAFLFPVRALSKVIQELVWVNNISLGKVALISRISATYLWVKCHLSPG